MLKARSDMEAHRGIAARSKADSLANVKFAPKLKLVGSSDETYGDGSSDVRAGSGILGELNVIAGVRGMRK